MRLKLTLAASAFAFLQAGCDSARPLPPAAASLPSSPADAGQHVQRATLKAILRDPHFSQPDPFAPYCEDLTGGEPIPPEMLVTLVQAQVLLGSKIPAAVYVDRRP